MKRSLASFIILGLWIFVCSYWYVCGMKDLCNVVAVPAGAVPVVLEMPVEEVVEPVQTPEPEPVKEPAPEPLILREVYFIFNTTLIKNLDDLDLNVRDAKEYLQNNQDAMIYLTGHTCDLGEEIKNYSLGIKRAEIVKEYMVDHGVEEKFIIDSKANNAPKNSNDPEIDRMYNRRVETIVKIPD